MQYLSRTGLMSVGEELTGTGEVWSAGACVWTFDHATAIQPQVTSAKTVGRPFMAVRACVPEAGLCPIRWPEVNGQRSRFDAETAMISQRAAYGGVVAVAATSFCPLGRTTVRSRPIGAPFLTGSNVTVTSSPALNDVRDHPRCVIAVGFCVSTAQFRTVPVSSFASNCRKQCGLLQIHSVTVPLTVTSLPVSSAAAPWWAMSGTDSSRTSAAITTPRNIFRTAMLLARQRLRRAFQSSLIE